MSEPGYEQLTLFQVDSRASHTALPESSAGQTMSAICGPSSCELSEKFSQEPSLVKMCLAYYLQYMMPYVPTWNKVVTKSGRFVYRLTLSVRTMRDTGWLLLPSTRASQDFKPIRKQTPQEHSKKHGNTLCAGLGIIFPELIGQHIDPEMLEWLMGFPGGWTDV